MEVYTNTIRNMTDEIDKNSLRGSRFVRATEINALTEIIKIKLIIMCKSLLEQISVLNEIPSSIHKRIDIVNCFFATLMDCPEFLAYFPKFRSVTESKAKELIDEIKSLNLEPLEILQDYIFYLSMLKVRSDYVEYNPALHAYKVVNSTVPLKTNRYNLRSKKQKIENNKTA